MARRLTSEATRDAERRIAAILQELEAETGQVVSDVRVIETEITRINDAYPERLASVSIDLARPSGHSWHT